MLGWLVKSCHSHNLLALCPDCRVSTFAHPHFARAVSLCSRGLNSWKRTVTALMRSKQRYLACVGGSKGWLSSLVFFKLRFILSRSKLLGNSLSVPDSKRKPLHRPIFIFTKFLSGIWYNFFAEKKINFQFFIFFSASFGEFIMKSVVTLSKSRWLFNDSSFICTAYTASSGTVPVRD